MFEDLENRLLFKGGVIGLQGRTVYVSGTAADDAITLRGSTKRLLVTLNGQTRAFVGKDVRRVVVYAGAGNDNVSGTRYARAGHRPLNVPAYIDGGTGNDALAGGLKGDTLLGGNGNDGLSGEQDRDPGDYHDGGPGDDRMSYGGTMNGGRGYDTATGDNLDDPIVSGVELLQTISDGRGTAENPAAINREDYRGNLSTRAERLVSRWPTTSGYETALGSPGVNAEGVLQITLTARFRSQGYQQPQSVVTTTLDRDDAARRGVVLQYDDTNGVFGNNGKRQWVLIPPVA